MLFIGLLKGTVGTPKERIARRVQWQYPEGIQLVAEYWPQTSDPVVVTIFETENVAPIAAVVTEWSDVFDISVFPAITAEEGLEMARQMMENE